MPAASSARVSALALLVLLALPGPARADYVPAPDVVVFCEPTLQPVVAAIARAWRQRTGIPVRIFPGTTGGLIELLVRRPRSDLIVGEGEAAADSAVSRGVIKPETRHALWRGRLVVAARAPAADTPGLAELAGKAKIAVVDPWAATAGADSRAALQALGLWDAVETKSVGVVDTADAAFLLDDGTVERAVLYATDVAADKHLTTVEPLAETLYPPIRYWVAEAQNSLSPNAQAFETVLLQASALAKTNGLEVLP